MVSRRTAWQGESHLHLVTRSKEFCIRTKETHKTETGATGPFTAEAGSVHRSFLDTLVQPVKLHRINLSLLQQNTPSPYVKFAHPTVLPLSKVSPVLLGIFIWFVSVALPIFITSPDSLPV